MRVGALRGDLSLLRSGLSLGWTFGAGSLEELARTALLLERDIYRTGSLVRAGEEVRFRLANPPLRLGAFHRIALTWDGRPVPADAAWVATDRRPEPRILASVSRSEPVELVTGEGSAFALAIPEGAELGPHRVRIDFASGAIPPRIWLEFADVLRDGTEP